MLSYTVLYLCISITDELLNMQATFECQMIYMLLYNLIYDKHNML